MKTMLVLGATSDIARATIFEFAKEGWNFYLAGRNLKELESLALKLQESFNLEIKVAYFDTSLSHDEVLKFWSDIGLYIDCVFCAIGYLGNQERANTDMDYSSLVLETNFTGLVPILSYVANSFEARKAGSIIVISSVAGDRGRARNCTYGASKAALTAYLSGLRQRLYASHVHVMTVLPGFVNTRMVAGRKLPKFITQKTEVVAKDIVRAFNKRQDVLYTSKIWCPIMFVTRHLPEWIFKRMAGV